MCFFISFPSQHINENEHTFNILLQKNRLFSKLKNDKFILKKEEQQELGTLSRKDCLSLETKLSLLEEGRIN